jgi:hypothetical protein
MQCTYNPFDDEVISHKQNKLCVHNFINKTNGQIL